LKLKIDFVKDKTPIIATIAVTLIILLGGVFALSGKGNTSSTTKVDDKILIGKASYQTKKSGAKITLVEFGDYECPACGYTHPAVKQILKEYEGEINYVFRHFPLPQHSKAQISAQVAEAAGEQGKFFEMHDLLYENQTNWVESKNPMNEFIKYAKKLKLNIEKFQTSVENNKFSNKINADLSDGAALNINSTPTFFVNGELLDGNPSFDVFQAKIAPLLK
jgi:protein-disulfide isomerase